MDITNNKSNGYLTMNSTQVTFTSTLTLEDVNSGLDIPLTGRVIQRIVLPIICSLGILGIIFTLIILSRKSMCTSTNCYLMALASTDLLFLLILATHLQEHQFVAFSKDYYHFIIYVTYSAILMQMFLFASVWLTVMLAVERFIGICKPFLASDLCTVTKARFTVIVIYLVAVICRAPNFWEVHVRTVNDSLSNDSLSYIEGSELSMDTDYIIWYPWMIDGVMTSILPFLLLVFFNGKLVWEVRRSTQYLQRNQMLRQTSDSGSGNGGGGSRVEREELQVTIMLISVIIVFFICQAPYVIYTAIVSINRYILTETLRTLRYVTILMLALKSSVNFLLYCWFSEKFSATFRKLFELKNMFKKRRDRRASSITSRLTVYSAKDTVV